MCGGDGIESYPPRHFGRGEKGLLGSDWGSWAWPTSNPLIYMVTPTRIELVFQP